MSLKITESSPVLVSKTRTGKDKFWQCHILSDGTSWFTQTSYWQVNKSGKQPSVQYSDPYEVTAKNVGKANETLLNEQAHLEFCAMITKQRDKGYSEVGTVSKIPPLPMLAQKFTDRKQELEYPAYVQPKYNGQRMLFDAVEGWSRGGKMIIPKCIEHIMTAFQGTTLWQDAVIVDGELLLPGNVLLQETMTVTKKYVPGISETLIYQVYDLVLPDVPFSHRYELLKEYVKTCANKSVELAPTYLVHNEQEIMKYHKQFVASGYEGTIIRDDSAGYEIGHRSNQLQKYKDFVDAEFNIIAVKEGNGRFKGAAIIQCITDTGKVFDCTPEGTMDHRRELYKNRNDLIGKWLTVRYQELSKAGAPLFPVGITIRDADDF